MPNPVFVTAPSLAAYIGSPETEQIQQIADLVNDLVFDEWLTPVEPIPARVRSIALNVAIRAAANPKGLTSWTRSWDDITRTERVEGARRMGIYLTDDELAELNGVLAGSKVVKSIRMVIPRWGIS